MGMTKINQSQVESAHANNKFVSIWGVRRGSANMDAIDKNPDLIQTDNLNGLIKLLE